MRVPHTSTGEQIKLPSPGEETSTRNAAGVAGAGGAPVRAPQSDPHPHQQSPQGASEPTAPHAPRVAAAADRGDAIPQLRPQTARYRCHGPAAQPCTIPYGTVRTCTAV